MERPLPSPDAETLVEFVNQPQKSPIGTIPIELLLDIFHLCDSDIRSRLLLTHTCRHWMNIATKVSSLWTNVVFDHRTSKKPPESNPSIMRLLDIQLDRAGRNLLDVTWYYDPTLHGNYVFIRLIRRNAPFRRWRTLSIEIDRESPLPPEVAGPDDAFTNLEMLRVMRDPICSLPHSILTLRPTPNLQKLDLVNSNVLQLDLKRDYGNSLNQINQLYMQMILIQGKNTDLPPNITNLGETMCMIHDFPHVMRYDVTFCVFQNGQRINLPSLTTFTAKHLLIDSQVEVPALQVLEFCTLSMGDMAAFRAPLLRLLRVPTHGERISEGHYLSLMHAFHHTGYQAWPTKSISIEHIIPKDEAAYILARCPTIEQVSISSDDPSMAEQILVQSTDARSG